MAGPPVRTVRPAFDPAESVDPPSEKEAGDRWSLLLDRTPSNPESFGLSVAYTLSDRPRWLDCRYLYDAEGSNLFTRITEQGEYYPTRAEAEILERHAGSLRRQLGPVQLVELGAGTSAKTRALLRAWCEADEGVQYVPVDIDPSVLRESAVALTREFPRLRVKSLATSYEGGLEHASRISPKALLFLGSTIGNMNPSEMEGFLERVAGALAPGDAFLLGADLVKDAAVLEAAYNDAAGYTAAFTKNLFARMNRELGTRIPLAAVEHVAYWNADLERIEIFARFTQEVELEIPSLQRRLRIAAGEMVNTEISRKFHVERLAGDVARFGFRLVRSFTDREGRFALLLFRRGKRRPGPTPRRRLAGELARMRAVTRELLEAVPAERRSSLRRAVRGRPGGAGSFAAGSARLPRPEDASDGALREEARAQEAILEAVARLGDVAYEPLRRSEARGAEGSPGPEMVLVPGGPFASGTERSNGSARRADWIEVPAFWIDTTPVTNGAFLRFVESGGYGRRELWSDEGWYHVRREGLAHPAGWRHGARGWEELHFGRVEPLLLERPVVRVSLHEAEAYARFAGKRLPTDEEWSKAAAWDPQQGAARRQPWGDRAPDASRANLDARSFAPDPVGSRPSGRSFYGCHQMVGDAWEWTASELEPAAPGGGPGLLAPRAGKGEHVLRGGSWATPAQVAHAELRRLEAPHRRDFFAGFRCARDT